MKLYELTAEEKNLQELFFNSIDEETGEIKDSEILEEMEAELKNALTVKSVGIIKVVRQQESDIETVTAEIERLENVKKRMKKSLDNFKKYIAYNIKQLELKKVETSLGSLSLRQTTATDIFNEKLIPQKFKKAKPIEYAISKTDIKKAIESGEEVQGARLILNTNLIIK